MVPQAVQAVVAEAVHQAAHRLPMAAPRLLMAAHRLRTAEAVHQVATE